MVDGEEKIDGGRRLMGRGRTWTGRGGVGFWCFFCSRRSGISKGLAWKLKIEEGEESVLQGIYTPSRQQHRVPIWILITWQKTRKSILACGNGNAYYQVGLSWKRRNANERE